MKDVQTDCPMAMSTLRLDNHLLLHLYTILTHVFLGVITLWFSLPQKFVELARQVGEFMTWKQVECPFEEDRAILHYLHTAPIFSEDGKNSALLISLPLNDQRVRFWSI